MRGVAEWAITHHNKNIGIVTHNHDILKHIYEEILRKLSFHHSSFSYTSSSRNRITMVNSTRIFLNIYRSEGIAPFIGLSLDVLLFHNYVADEQRRAISRIMSPALSRGCIVGTLIT
jgi:hypothetical protein